ncbi:stage II sporulation protein M [Candidatus Acetothermia bacterium]|nr:stage II sporulation protein M [Candidatus Acetothermia bacterium]MBI3643821.1 stage II sporulation protein M [Candidatus Acetothermia bacterium]
MIKKDAQWEELSSLLSQIEKMGLKSLSQEQVLEFGRLYRRAASDLSYAQAHGLDPNERRYLNALLGRVYGYIYHNDSKRFTAKKFFHFFWVEFPAAVRKEWPFLALSFGVFLLSSIIAFWATWNDPSYAEALLPPGMIQGIQGVVERHQIRGDWMPGIIRPVASSTIMTNNIKVAFVTFSTGILAGLGTIYFLFYNGLMLGAVASSIGQTDPATISNFWGFVLPHGVLELPAIFLAGAAGLILGYALINPGDYDRKTALKLAGRRALKIILGVIAMLVVAGTIEGFFSPSLTPDIDKFIVAGTLFSGLIIYLFLMPLPNKSNS